MNTNINVVLKAAETKFSPRKKAQDDKGESFIRSFNKLLEKKKLEDKKDLKDKFKNKTRDSGEEEKKPEDLREYVNINYSLNSRCEEKSLNSDLPIESLEDALIINAEEAFGEESFNLETLVNELEGQLQNLNPEKLVDDSLLEVSLDKGEESLNFSIEEAKANLAQALNKDPKGVNLEEKSLINPKVEEVSKSLTENQTLEDSKDLEVKSELLDKEGLLSDSKKAGKTSSKPVEEAKTIDTSRLDPILKAENLEKASEENIKLEDLDLEDMNILKEDKGNIKEEEKAAKENPNLEEAKAIDSNMIFNRIQNSILGFQEEDTLSAQNIQSIEDSMIKFMKVSKEGDTSVMRVKLYPEELGSIDISLKLDKGKLVADIIVASEKIKEMFLNNSSLLNKNLIEANLPIKNINIKVQEAFDNLESFHGDTGKGGSREGNKQGTDTRRNISRDIINSPIDSMRIGNINRSNLGSKSLNILA